MNVIRLFIIQTFPDICQSPYDVQCRTRDDQINWNETDDILFVPCSANQGLLCLNSDQLEGACREYELRFLCPQDINECEDPSVCPDPNSECVNTHGSYICRCKGDYYMYDDKCVASRPCTGWGDPHYTTFDKRRFDFQGTCHYVLSEPCHDVNTSDKLVTYRVLAKNEYRNRVQRNRRVSQTKSILVEVYGYSVELRQLGRVSSNGVEQTLPVYIHNAEATRPGSFIEVRQLVDGVSLTTDFGLYVHFDGKNRFRLTLADSYAGEVCGLCGDFNGDPSNDFLMSNGSMATDVSHFGNSWKDVALSDVGCDDGQTPNPECETWDEQIQVNRLCSVISDPEGPFSACHGVVDPDEYEYGCAYDLCSDIHNEEMLCDAIAAYAEVCKEHGVIISWRSDELCAPTCLPHSYFSDLVTSCPNTCTDPTAAVNCQLPQVSGCVCDPGLLLSGDLCVQPEMCGCVSEGGAYHKLGDAWYQGNCTTLCECRDEGAIVCDNNVACHSDGSCISLPGGVMTCVCNPGYTGQPYNCTDIDECVEDIHYCHDGADCINTDGSYQCECKDGFTGNGFDCQDVDECLTNPCHVYASCVNEPGSYSCYCLSGYTGDGSYCQEILDPDLGNVSDGEKNGCSFYMEYCSDIATCLDLPDGQFICQCPDGANGDGLKDGTGCQYHGTVEFNYNCYQFVETSLSFYEARKECQMRGGDLASLATAGSLLFIRQYGDNNEISGTFWIGYTDSLWSGTFVWLDGSISAHTYWTPDEPELKASQHCVFVDVGYNATYRFHTADCGAVRNFICQQSRRPQGCPVGWSQTADGGCVTLFDDAMTYFDAYMTCVTHGADFISVNETEQLKDISNMFDSTDLPFWIGLNDGYFNQLDGTYHWTDNSMPPVQMKADLDGMTCVIWDIWNRTYSPVSCDDQNIFFCTRRYGDKCHKLKPEKSLTRDEAILSCNNMGGDLVTIATEAKQTFIREWIGKRMTEVNYWIGLIEDTNDDNYTWSDGTKYEYTNWGKGQPSDPNSNGCVYIDAAQRYAWADMACDAHLAFICEYYNTPCRNNDDCHQNGQCYLGQCRCKNGYIGDGRDVCTDILACEGDADCHKNGHCNISRLCECKIGYDGNGKNYCTNVDECSLGIHECHKDANCYDTDGYYDCVCKDGFTGNGRECQDIPTSCDFLKRREPKTDSGMYVIDPDGPGGVAPFMVECDMRTDRGVTVVSHDAMHMIKVSVYPEPESYEKIIRYKYGSIEQMLALINISDFCYQEMTFQCDNGAPLDGYYVDGAGFRRNKWGGAVTEGKCPCGEIGSCTTPGSNCNCDGNGFITSYDYGKLTDKNQLPVTKLVFGRISGISKAYHTLSALYCGPRQFGIPTDCDEARWRYHISYDTPVLIDVDGPDEDEAGNLSPFLAHCDMTSYLHVGVTEIPHDMDICGRLRGLAVACWTTDHYHLCSNPGVDISEGCFIFDFASLPLERFFIVEFVKGLAGFHPAVQIVSSDGLTVFVVVCIKFVQQ
ncbi:hypothetical protein LSH36_662g04064 [Paralvinella palmiformis]|uniref:Uncharacterized protein n=1 Tax=Paralvinella palmiformis TaxID=53620 RepID=A0AAD9MWL4_9ANNE|nr:hypothetical protein LSH36_662g04064 [Paralvinella palmiformis]